ncbi:MAG: hypothetical protein IID08_04945 [Candidatus Hydrogenedentes bacterium]|nr:hypothetical protein [Candidatus Hydrogenedentota bacterium]
MNRIGISGLALVVAAVSFRVGAAPVLPVTDIAPEHPLFIFAAPGADAEDAMAQAAEVAEAWFALPDSLRPYTVLRIDTPSTDFERRHRQLHGLLTELQQIPLPVALKVADGDPRGMYPVAALEALLNEFTTVKGLYVSGLRFNRYPPYGDDPRGIPVEAQWLSNVIETAASYGRFVAVALDELHWLRIMSSPVYQPLFDTIREHKAHVIPLNLHRGPHNIARTSSMLGSWIEGRVDQWGVALTSAWYGDARFVTPGVFGTSQSEARMPPGLYRAMVLNGAMTGAQVYAFDEPADLWAGARRFHWDQAIRPTLEEIVRGGFIARKEAVARKTKVGYQLTIAETPDRFRENIDDLDAVYGSGNMLRAAYGIEHAGQVPELILNNGDHYWIPVFSPWAGPETLASFKAILKPGDVADAAAWSQLLDFQYTPDGEGDAFIARVGRGYFVMHTRENLYVEQTYRIPGLPAAVRGLKVERREGKVLLTWPYREDDFSYTVYRRVLPATEFVPVAKAIDERQYIDTDTPPEATVSYTVSALTNEREPHEGTVNFGDYLVFSSAESRLAEEVVVYPLTEVATGSPIRKTSEMRPADQSWWPNVDTLSGEQRGIAEDVAARIVSWGEAFEQKDLNAIAELYHNAYRDIQGAGHEYARQLYAAFFDRHRALHMHRQIRSWDFSTYFSTGEVRVLLYCRFTGARDIAVHGVLADVPASFPDHASSEVWVTFMRADGAWRIVQTNPALPGLADLLDLEDG